MKKLAAIRIRGDVNIKPDIKETLKSLKLYKKNYCVIVPSKPAHTGMLQKAKDYITFGELNEATFIKLLEKRGRITNKTPLTADYLKKEAKTDFKGFAKEFMGAKKELKDIPGLKTFFKLHPPIGGFERKGIKKPYSIGGALGYRKEKINDLILKMI
jgi:large subunit ribosomal protein L30